MSGTPEISVVIPTRDRWSLLAAHALPSALEQEDVALEVIVVDDGSQDGTAERAAGLGDDRIRVVRCEKSRRLAGARNAGIAVARAPWLAFLDDDDLWAPEKLRTQIDLASAGGSEWAYADTVVVDEQLRVLEADDFPDPDELPSLLLTGNHVPGGGSSVIARTDAVREVGGFDEGLLFFTDWDLWLRLVQRGLPEACAEPLVARLVHPTNMLFREGPAVLESLERMLGKHREVTREDRLAIAQWVAHRYRLAGRHGDAARLYFDAARRYRSPGNAVAAAGSLAGPQGVRAAAWLLRRVRGESHLDEKPRSAPADPPWLERFRSPS
ncbi:MAG: glycosyltransferase family 2 protein [Actinomycetota bacterium]